MIPEEIYQACKNYEENKDELQLKEGIRSVTSFLNYCLREYLKDKGII